MTKPYSQFGLPVVVMGYDGLVVHPDSPIQLSNDLVLTTAHIMLGKELKRCQSCDALVKTYIVTPGSPFVWCTNCW